MFSSISKVVALAILVVAAGASPTANGHGGPTTTVTVTAQPTSTSVSQCNTGGTNKAQCCKTVQSCTSKDVTAVLELLGVDVQGLDGVLQCGLNCVNIAGSTCSETQQPVCCENNNFNGLVNIGCTPITVNA